VLSGFETVVSTVQKIGSLTLRVTSTATNERSGISGFVQVARHLTRVIFEENAHFQISAVVQILATLHVLEMPGTQLTWRRRVFEEIGPYGQLFVNLQTDL
jgi:hypothetical protein